jgi:hypothetical protein
MSVAGRESSHEAAEAYAPFGAMAPRETIFETTSLGAQADPAPGSTHVSLSMKCLPEWCAVGRRHPRCAGQYNVSRPVGLDTVGGSSLANKVRPLASM